MKEYRQGTILNIKSTKETPGNDRDDEKILFEKASSLDELIPDNVETEIIANSNKVEENPSINEILPVKTATDRLTVENIINEKTVTIDELLDMKEDIPDRSNIEERIEDDTQTDSSMTSETVISDEKQRQESQEQPKNDDEMYIEGVAVIFNTRQKIASFDDIDYYEVIDPHSFDGVDLSDCCLRYNHSEGFSILARTRNKSLELWIDEEGLKFRARIVDTQQGRDVYKLIQEGLVNACSFGFVVAEDTFDPMTNTRRILKFANVFEISLVDFPAYEDTRVSISERDYFSAKHEIVKIKQREDLRKKLILLSY